VLYDPPPVAFYTPLPIEDARRIGERYGLVALDVQGIRGGSVNSNYALSLAGGGRAFVRIFEEQTKATAAREAKMLDHLAEGGVPTPRPLSRIDRRGFICSFADKPVAVFPWVEGESLCQKLVTQDAVFRVGKALARVHLASADFDGAPVSRFRTQKLEARLEAIPRAAQSDELADAVRMLSSRLAVMPRPAPPKLGVIHGDLFRDNVLWKGPEITALLDFESASRGSPAFDLGVTLLAWCYTGDLDAELCRALVAGYQEDRPLAPSDRAELFHQMRLAAIRFAVTRITDFELRPRGAGIFKDYRRFLARLRRIEALGEAGLLTLLGL
jgi:homoserine kinase type II